MSAVALPGSDEDEESFCNNVEQQIDGPGGIWLDHEGDTHAPAAPQLTGTDPASPSLSGAPRIVGAAEAGSTVTVFAGPGCPGAPIATVPAAALGSPGVPVNVAEGATAAFSAKATDPAGNTSACSAPISYTRLTVPVDTGAPVDTGGGGDGQPLPAPPPAPPPPASSACIVPKLAGKKLAGAKKALKAARCRVGEVTKPKRPKGKKRWVLVVKRSSPRRGAKPADGKVDLKLGPKPKPRPKR